MRALNANDASPDTSACSWRKSTRSAHNGGCVEVAPLPGRRLAVRDSKNPAGAPVVLTAGDWSAFLHEIKSGAVSL